ERFGRLTVVGEESVEDRLLVWEVVEQRARPDTGSATDRRRRRPVEATLGEHLRGGVEDPGAPPRVPNGIDRPHQRVSLGPFVGSLPTSSSPVARSRLVVPPCRRRTSPIATSIAIRIGTTYWSHPSLSGSDCSQTGISKSGRIWRSQ